MFIVGQIIQKLKSYAILFGTNTLKKFSLPQAAKATKLSLNLRSNSKYYF